MLEEDAMRMFCARPAERGVVLAFLLPVCGVPVFGVPFGVVATLLAGIFGVVGVTLFFPFVPVLGRSRVCSRPPTGLGDSGILRDKLDVWRDMGLACGVEMVRVRPGLACGVDIVRARCGEGLRG